MVRTFTLSSHHGGHVVSASGVFLAEDYKPGAARQRHAGPALDPRGDLVLGAPLGAAVLRYRVAGGEFVDGGAVGTSGSSLAAM